MTSIEWTDVTWNPVRGCGRVSRGCEHCYAEGVARRFAGAGQPYEGLVRLDREGKPKAQWNGTVRFVPEHLADPMRWRKPRRVFVNSMSDLFHETLAFEQIAAVFGVMAASPRHTFQVLTKRPERAREFFTWIASNDRCWRPDEVAQLAARAHVGDVVLHPIKGTLREWPWPLPNVWLGVSVEDQATADERIPALLSLPAGVRWVSYEPALGPVRFGPPYGNGRGSSWLGMVCERGHFCGRDYISEVPGTCPAFVGSWPCGAAVRPALDWIVVGGESGPGARPFDIAWARSTVDACRAAGTKCFVKQLGARPVEDIAATPGASWASPPRLLLADRKGGDMTEWPEDLRVREWPEVRRG